MEQGHVGERFEEGREDREKEDEVVKGVGCLVGKKYARLRTEFTHKVMSNNFSPPFCLPASCVLDITLN
jgi:hypothetical protein